MIIRQDNYGSVSVVENEKYQHGVINEAGELVVPFGKYAWISGYDHGLARVKSIFGNESIDLVSGKIEKAKWGIIDESGQEVLPVIYDEIWYFFKKSRSNTSVVINGYEKQFDLNSRQLSDYSRANYSSVRAFSDHEDDYGTHYGAYAGSYAQDVMGCIAMMSLMTHLRAIRITIGILIKTVFCKTNNGFARLSYICNVI